MEILTANEMREIDRKAIEDYKIPCVALMENAGVQTAIALEERFKDLSKKKVAVFAGKGNNGGDGVVAARHLMNKGIKVDIFLFAKKKDSSSDSRINLNIAQNMGIPVHEIENFYHFENFKNHLTHSHIFIDALLGTGIVPPVKGIYKSVIPFINDLKKFVLSIDIPSGLNSDDGNVEGEFIKADMTVAFCRPKRCHFLYPAANYVGDVKIVDIGIPDKIVKEENINVFTLNKNDIQFLFNKRKPDSHKGTFGHLLVIGGSSGKGGAAALASLSALKIGTGLVTLSVPKSINASIEMNPLEVMSVPLPETDNGCMSIAAREIIAKALENKSAALIGPGISTHPETIELLLKLIPEIKIPLIIDADGLNCLCGHLDIIRNLKAPVIITPHPGEMARLIEMPVDKVQSDRIGIAQKLALDYNVFVVLKGAATVVALPTGKVFINTTGNPGMATAGTGDVLAGIVAGLAAQKVEAGDAVKAAVFIHGTAGDIVSGRNGQISLIASDLIKELPGIINRN